MKTYQSIFLTAVLGSFASHSAFAKDPNIIVIFTDDEGWGATSVQMDDQVPESKSDFMQTPNLERLATRGMRFANGYTCHPNSSPSRYALLTGKTPARLGMTDIIERPGQETDPKRRLLTPPNVRMINSNEITIGEIIKQHKPNYKTAYFGKWHLGNNGPEQHGFDAGDGATGNGKGNQKIADDPKLIFSLSQRSVNWIEQQVNDNKPFFLEIAHYATHESSESLAATLQKYQNLPKGTRHNNAGYAAMTEDMDTGIGIVLDKLQELGIEDSTYIFFLADNGSMPGMNPGNTNGPIRGSKATVWEGGIKTPFIVAGPGIKGDIVSRVRVVGWDIFPTICDILGITELPQNLDGGSILPVLQNDNGEGEVTRSYDFMVWHWPRYVFNKEGYPTTAIIKGDYKYIYSYETEEELLFNIVEDIAETTPLNSQLPDKLIELRTDMQNYLTEVNAGLPTPNPHYSGGGTKVLENLIFYFPFEDNYNDMTGQMQTLGQNSPGFDTGKYGRALSLNGSSQWLDVLSGDYMNPDFSELPFTLCGWVYNTDAHAQNNSIILAQHDDSNSGTGRIILEKFRQSGAACLSTFLGGSRTTATVNNFPNNEWVHVAAVGDYTTNTITFYRNGEQNGDRVTINPFESCVGNFRIGAHKDGTRAYWSGKLDELYLFKEELSQSDIVKIMNDEWDKPMGVNKTFSNNVFVYVDPAKYSLVVNGLDNISALTLISIDGRVLKKEYFTKVINIGLINPGHYLLKIEAKNQPTVIKKIII